MLVGMYKVIIFIDTFDPFYAAGKLGINLDLAAILHISSPKRQRQGC
jgi:hypothetical protein